MKHRIIQSLSIAIMAACLAASAASMQQVSAKGSEPREIYNNDKYYVKHYIYYTNGAMVSLNNLVGDSYNFDDDTMFNKRIKSLASKYIPNVIYDDTDSLRKEVGADDNAKLSSIYKMPSKKTQILTNYTDKELKNKGLLPEDDVIQNSNGSVSDTSSISENVVESEDASTSELVQAASYLIGKDYYTLPRTITYRTAKSQYGPSGSLSVDRSWITAYNGTSTNMLKSDLIMMLSKIYRGVQPSSAIVVDDESYRKGRVWETVDPTQEMKSSKAESYFSEGKAGMDYYGYTTNVYGGDAYWKGSHVWKGETHKGVQFQGDYYVYYDPNVYELYLTQAINDGIITKADLAEKYRSIYTSKSKTAWKTGEVYLADSTPDNVLGKSIKMSYDGGTLKIEATKPEYFGENESMTMIEALRLIEAYMRSNDENMSKTEESIIQYKFGLNVLAYLNESDQSTITYLIAKGILDSSSGSLSGMLNDNATISKLFPILYRVANKSARIDFSTIQLTDSETYWASKDFSADSISVFETDDPIIHETGTITTGPKRTTSKNGTIIDPDEDNVSVRTSSISGSRKFLLGKPPVLEVSAAVEIKTYEITKYFDTKSVYRIGNTTIAQIYSNNSDAEKAKYSIKSIEKLENDKGYEYRGKKHDVYKVVFSVSATKQSAAINAVEQKYSVMSDIDKYKKTLNGVTSIEKNGTKSTLVSQTSLRQSFSNITVLEDKILMNNVTGTMAYFSYDSKKSIVGSQIIDNGYASIVKAGNEVYYNLETILPLLSSAYVDTIGPQISIVVTDIDHTHNISIATSLTDASDYPLKAQYIKVYQSGDKKHENDDRYGFACIATSDAKKAIKGTSHGVGYYVKLNSLSTAANKLTKSFSIDYNGTEISGTLLVDLQYVVPDAGDFPSWLSRHVFSTDRLTYQQASQLMITPPDKINELHGFNNTTKSISDVEKSALNSWWYSNYGMSNALCNFMFGTEGQVYIHSGYVCPSVTVLVNNIGNKSFEDWCGTNKTKALNKRDTILKQIFNDFTLGESYLRYNGGSSKNIWKNFYQMDASNPDYTDLGFPSGNKKITNTIYASRRFEIYCQPGKSALKKNKLGKQASENSFRTYGTRYAVAGSGCVYENIDTLGTAQHPMFKYTCNQKKGENSTLHSLKLLSRTAETIIPNKNQIVYLDGKEIRYYSEFSSNTARYYAVYPEKLFNADGNLNFQSVKLVLKKQSVLRNSRVVYTPYCKYGTRSASIDGSNFATNVYSAKYITMLNEADTFPGVEFVRDMVKDEDSNLFFDPSLIARNTTLLKDIFGSDPVYIYTDKDANSDLSTPGNIYHWDGKRLIKCTSADITNLCSNQTEIYAIPLYFAPCDTFYFQKDSIGNIVLGSDALSKALNYIQFDLTSLNNQLIEAYLNEQSGIKSINKLDNGSTVMIGDTVWVKKGDWFQSKAIKDSTSAKVAASKKKKAINMMWFANKKFTGNYVTVQGHKYSLPAYIKEMALGGKVGSSSQFKKGVVYMSGNSVMVRKKDKVSKANKNTSAQYLSVKAKFDDNLLVRPIDTDNRKFALVSHCDTGLITSANYPFFDESASWDRDSKNQFSISQSKFKPSAQFEAAKKEFLKDFAAALAEDSWNYVWVIIIVLCCYLLVMSWFSYCVLTMGVGRAGFEALTLPDVSGNKKGIDLIKFATFGLYSLDKQLSLARAVVISFCCCVIIITILILIF